MDLYLQKDMSAHLENATVRVSSSFFVFSATANLRRTSVDFKCQVS